MSMPGAGQDSAMAPWACSCGKTQLFFPLLQSWLLVNVVGTVQVEMFYGLTSA